MALPYPYLYLCLVSDLCLCHYLCLSLGGGPCLFISGTLSSSFTVSVLLSVSLFLTVFLSISVSTSGTVCFMFHVLAGSYCSRTERPPSFTPKPLPYQGCNSHPGHLSPGAKTATPIGNQNTMELEGNSGQSSHFTDGETESQRLQGTLPGHSELVEREGGRLRWRPRTLTPGKEGLAGRDVEEPSVHPQRSPPRSREACLAHHHRAVPPLDSPSPQ